MCNVGFWCAHNGSLKDEKMNVVDEESVTATIVTWTKKRIHIAEENERTKVFYVFVHNKKTNKSFSWCNNTIQIIYFKFNKSWFVINIYVWAMIGHS